MHILRAIVKNYRCLREANVAFNPELNIIVGNNECGKSTLLEAINLALSGQLNGRPIQAELHPHLFNAEIVNEYIQGLITKKSVTPPTISVEVYFDDDQSLAKLKGTNNSRGENLPGVTLSIEFNDEYAEEYGAYVASPERIRTMPVEYYAVRWLSFADNEITSRSIPIKPAFIDASSLRNNLAANRYIGDIIRDSLSKGQKVDLALSYRIMKDAFMKDAKVKSVNAALAAKKGEISDKILTVALDTSSRSNWETGIMPQLDDIPLTLVGKGEQNSVKIKLAMDASSESQLILIEEAENHLSFSNLNALIGHIADKRGERQLIITTHSSFVLNKLGVESVILFSRHNAINLNALNGDTHDYFMRLPGHDTLRLILAKKSILVEGPSDELIVQAAFKKKHGKMPLEAGVDVISVNSLAFKRFLEIAKLLKHPVAVITDNDGDISALQSKYADYANETDIKICYDVDSSCETLEPQLLKANSRLVIEKILGKSFSDDASLVNYMKKNKTDVALSFFTTSEPWDVPEYISHAIS